MRKLVVIVFILVISAFLLGLFFNKLVFTGKVIDTNLASYSWTKAICNSENKCVDVKIDCENGKVSSVELVSGMIENPEDWIDPRNNSEALC